MNKRSNAMSHETANGQPLQVSTEPANRHAGRVLEVQRVPGEKDSVTLSKRVLKPVVGAAITAHAFRPIGIESVELGEMAKELERQCEAVAGGDLTRMESMLTSHAHALDAIFHSLAFRAAANMERFPETAEMYLKLALKAQSQARTTAESLATIKNPPVVYAKTANVAHNQQINNGVAEAVPSPQAEKTEIRPNELLEAPRG